MRVYETFNQFKTCPMCQSAWISAIIISTLTLLCNEFFVFGYPLVQILIYNALTKEPRTYGSISSAARIADMYESPKEGMPK